MGSWRKAISMALTGLVVVAGCDLVEPDPLQERASELARQRAIWAAADVESYRLRLSRSCECLPEMSGNFILTVIEGELIAAERPGTGEPVQEQYLQWLETVDDLFDHIEHGITTGADGWDVEYHAQLGYPTRVAITHGTMVDEPVFHASDLEPIGILR